MTTTTIKTRFAPSPTGLIHLGNTRTALFNALLAKNANGVFLLRIEDTDKTRSDEQYTRALMEDLTWLDLLWQEGPEHDGGHGPYWQSQRQVIYDEYYRHLEQSEFAYPCFCSEQQLALARKVQRAAGKPPRYPGTCRNLNANEIAAKLAQGLQPTLRFRVPADQTIVFHDLVRGEQRFNTNDLGDFIIRRGDGTPPFMYCNAIDDACMKVTHALRGEDHLTNTPRQILILQALQLPIPLYGHITLIVGPDGTPLSKRHGSRNVQEMRGQGFLPAAIINYLARLGHYYADEHFMSLEQLAEKFSLSNLGHAPARFDFNQLLHWQREALLQTDEKKLWTWMGTEVHEFVPETLRENFIAAIRTNILFPEEALHWAKIFFTEQLLIGHMTDHEPREILKQAGADFFAVALATVNNAGADYQAVSAALKQQLNVKGKALFQPLRVALTGELHGPELEKVFLLLGKEKISARLIRAMDEA